MTTPLRSPGPASFSPLGGSLLRNKRISIRQLSDSIEASEDPPLVPPLRGRTRTAFLCFFVSHIPITLIVDGQAFLPSEWYPLVLRDLVDWYAATFKDDLMTRPYQTWFTSIVGLEVLFQLPFFFLAVYALLQRPTATTNPRKKGYSYNDNPLIQGDGIFRSLCLIYGSSTATTLIPIFGCLLTSENTTFWGKAVLMCFYLPYFIFPMWLTAIAVCGENVFGDEMIYGSGVNVFGGKKD